MKTYDYPDHWQIKAKYRYRMAHAKEDGTYKKKWYYDGWVNYILVPKYTYIYLPLTDLEYDRYDESTGIFYLDDVRVYTYNGETITYTMMRRRLIRFTRMFTISMEPSISVKKCPVFIEIKTIKMS